MRGGGGGGGGSARMARRVVRWPALPLPWPSWQQLQLLFSGGEREHVFLASSGSEASMASGVGTLLGSRRQFCPNFSFLSPKQNRVVVVGLRRRSPFASLFSWEICGVVVATLCLFSTGVAIRLKVKRKIKKTLVMRFSFFFRF